MLCLSQKNFCLYKLAEMEPYPMLRYFTVTNWKPVYELAELSMVATQEKRYGERLSKFRRSRVLAVAEILWR
jgi:hypothetical protein